jgi:hypothetical protein
LTKSAIIALIETTDFMNRRGFMESEKTDPKPNSAEADSAAKESVETGKSENRVENDSSYVRSRQIALKKFISPEGEP